MDYDIIADRVYTNQAYEKYIISEFSIEELYNIEKCKNAVYPDDLNLCKAFVQQSIDGNESVEATLRIKMKDGTYRWPLMRGYFLYDENGKRIRNIQTFQDVNDITLPFNNNALRRYS